MASYVVEVYRPGLTAASAARLGEVLEVALGSIDGGDTRLRYRGSTLAPADEVCYLRLESPERSLVEALIDRLAWSDARISEVVDLG